jgi:hypothetical protein
MVPYDTPQSITMVSMAYIALGEKFTRTVYRFVFTFDKVRKGAYITNDSFRACSTPDKKYLP